MGQPQNRTASPATARGSVLRLIPLFCALAGVTTSGAQPAAGSLSPAVAQALVSRALDNELRAAQDSSTPMRYTLHKITTRLTSTKQIVETKDGDVARLIA